MDGNVVFCILILFSVSFTVLEGRKHTLDLQDENRKEVHLTTFGFFKGGSLVVEIKNLVLKDFFKKNENTGKLATNFTNQLYFFLDKTNTRGISPYLESGSDDCAYRDKPQDDSGVSIVYFILDFTNREMIIKRGTEDLSNIKIEQILETPRRTSQTNATSPSQRRRRAAASDKKEETEKKKLKGKKAGENLGKNNEKLKAQKENQNKKTEPTKSDPTNGDQTKNATPKPNQDNNGKAQTNKSEVIAMPQTDKDQNGTQEAARTESVKTDKTDATTTSNPVITIPVLTQILFPEAKSTVNKDDAQLQNLKFQVFMDTVNESGLYNLFFRNCHSNENSLDLTVSLVEENRGSFLSAGEMPLPTMYFLLSLVVFAIGIFWLVILKSSKEEVFKTHYIMSVLVFVKALSMLLHAVNFHIVSVTGERIEAMAIIWYITYLIRGILLFMTIVLIGAGFAFVKHILSDREKKIFVIVIPLQVLANVASILVEETEEGNSSYTLWKEMLILVDLLCCGAVLFPVIWSIRHLQVAANTDGKAIISLKKLKLFRHFYILIVCYIYFTRIIVYLLKITLPYDYEWMNDLFREFGTIIVFIITGYKFRPESNNPYLRLPEDEEEEMEEVLTESGITEGLTHVNVKTGSTLNQRESSHEYD